MAYLACAWPACVLALPRVAVAASDKGRSPGSPVTVTAAKNRALIQHHWLADAVLPKRIKFGALDQWEEARRPLECEDGSGIGGEPQCRGHYDHRDRACPGPVAGHSGHSDRPILD